MKHLLKLIFALTVVLGMVACEKENKESAMHERNIVYTVDADRHDAHLKTDAEFDALLERFCDYAEGGSTVTFYRLGTQPSRLPASGTLAHPTKDATTFSTASREEMKRWMARMEDDGMTVTVTYDPATGTWSGTAYATAPQQHDCYTGLLTEVPNPQMTEGPNPPGMVMALQLNEDSTLIIADHGQWFWDGYLPQDSVATYPGGTMTLCGTLQTRQDYYGNTFLQLEIGEVLPEPTPGPVPHPNGGVLTYVSDASPMWCVVLSIDTVNRLMYSTVMMYDSINPFIGYNLYVPVGISRYHYYSPADSGGTTYEDKVWLYVENDEGLDYPGEHYCITGSLDFSGGFTLHYADAAPTDGYTVTDFPFVRNDEILTSVHRSEYCDVVLHLNTDGQYSEGQSYLLSRVNCVLPFESGKFSYAPQLDTIAYYNDRQFPSVKRLRYSVTGSTPTFGIDYPDCPCSYWVPLGDTPSCIETFHFEHL